MSRWGQGGIKVWSKWGQGWVKVDFTWGQDGVTASTKTRNLAPFPSSDSLTPATSYSMRRSITPAAVSEGEGRTKRFFPPNDFSLLLRLQIQ